MYSIDVCESWLYDDNKPFVHLEKLKAFDELKKEAGEGLFEQLIQETMLDNPHSAVVLGMPKKGLTTEEEKKTEEKLAAYKASLSREQLEKLVEKTRKLKEFQDSEDSAEAKAKIPMLKRSDIGKEALKIYNTPHHVTGNTVLHHNLDTNGITYLTLLFDTKQVPDELISYMES